MINNIISHETDFCVAGGGLSGICAAISTVRLGLKVVIMQDRPMFGGNAVSLISYILVFHLHLCI